MRATLRDAGIALAIFAVAMALAVAVTSRADGQETWNLLRVAPEQPREGYKRPYWNVRDTDIWDEDGNPPCTPYGRHPIERVGRGDGLDKEHIVALAEAWDSRPNDYIDLRAIAEDHLNLTMARARENRQKSDDDAAEWQPEHNRAWYAAQVLMVKVKYDLSVDPAERDALARMLLSGPADMDCE